MRFQKFGESHRNNGISVSAPTKTEIAPDFFIISQKATSIKCDYVIQI